MSLNCRGLNNNKKRLDVFKYMKENKYNIYCIQDTHFVKIQEKIIYSQWNGECFSSFSRSNARGVSILFNKNFENKVHTSIIDTEGNYVALDITIESQRLTLISIYGPNSDSPHFYESIFNIIDNIGNDTYIICGDFNLVLNPQKDYYNYKHVNNKRARDKLINFISERQLLDPYRENYPDLYRYTWRRTNPLKQARLDFFLITEDLLPNIKKCKIEPSYKSDHSITSIQVSFTNISHGKGLWKHNNSLLSDIDYLNSIKKKITEIKRQYCLPVYDIENLDNIPNEEIQFIINDQLFLETLLMELRGQSISYGSFKKKQENKFESDLLLEINKLEQSLNTEKVDELNVLRNDLNNYREKKLRGHILRSKVQLIEDGEKPSKFFCNLEKHNYLSKVIPKLEKDTSEVVTSQSEIIQEIHNYYKDLYSCKDKELLNNDLESEFKNLNTSKLSSTESLSIEGELSYSEASKTLFAMTNDRSPGSDGFSSNFFKMFWKQLGFFVVRSINYAFHNGLMSVTQRQGIITCIPKENKPRHFIKNWRPITLLNTVYKIASGAISNRIKTVLDKLISKEQTGFLKGRFIGENIRLVYDVMQYVEDNSSPGLLLLIDFEKAFDSLSWSFIQKTLDFFNFGDSIKRWLHIFYNDIQSSVTQCGFLTDFFNVGRGCRQGDPLSPYIFILCTEILTQKLKNNHSIKGIKIGDKEHKLSMFADDTSILLDGSSESLNQTLKELEYFSRISGLKINFDKTHVIWLGLNKYSTAAIKTKYKLIWGQSEFKLLGIKFHVDLDKMINMNYVEKIKKLDNSIRYWNRRYVTPLGKITVIKSLLIPSFNHLFISLPNPSADTVKTINKKLYDFLWHGPAKIKSTVVTKNYSEGGLKMINLEMFIKSLKITWIRRLIMTHGDWQLLTINYFDIGKIVNCGKHYTEKIISQIKNKFWKNVLLAFSEFSSSIKNDTEDYSKCPLFYNSNILIGNKSIFLKSWYDKGIRYINDILDENGRILNKATFEKISDMKVNYLHYMGMENAISKYLKLNDSSIECLTKVDNPIIPKHVHIILINKRGTKLIYEVLTSNNESPTSQIKWNQRYNIEQNDWKFFYSLPFNSIKDTNCQWLQVRILHRILPLNDYLFKLKLNSSPNCTFCNNENETIEHLFWYCNSTQALYSEVKSFCENHYIVPVLNEIDVIFGAKSCPQNVLITLLKQYIFQARSLNNRLSFLCLKKFLKYYFDIHKSLAVKNRVYEKFLKEWCIINSIIT